VRRDLPIAVLLAPSLALRVGLTLGDAHLSEFYTEENRGLFRHSRPRVPFPYFFPVSRLRSGAWVIGLSEAFLALFLFLFRFSVVLAVLAFRCVPWVTM